MTAETRFPVYSRPLFVVFDLDGTLADTKHREHYVQRPVGEKDWRGFFAACDRDQPIAPVLATLRAMVDAGHEVEIWTGRSAEVADKTQAWLLRYGLQGLPLRSRPEGDHTADTDLKAAWLEQHSRKPDLVFEDRASVVAMWRSHGIVCCQVAPGEF
jgi:FMN phosphatase YigB (HAD superfamily)